MGQLSSYRLMWMMVMFDLPVGTKKERKVATGFRNFLVNQGFEMAQLSVYLRFSTSKVHSESLTTRVREQVPEGGKVDILLFTDKQYERMISYVGRRQQKRKNPDQFTLF